MVSELRGRIGHTLTDLVTGVHADTDLVLDVSDEFPAGWLDTEAGHLALQAFADETAP